MINFMAYFIRKQLKHSTSKRGLILPIVMVFVLISQLIYWGLLHLNQTNSQRLINFQAYYQAQIQQLLTQDYLYQAPSAYLEMIEFQIMLSMQNSFDVLKPAINTKEWWIQTPQFGIASLESPNNVERIFIYEHQLFIDESELAYCSSFNLLFCAGKLNSNQTYDPLSFEMTTHDFGDVVVSSVMYQEEIELLLREGFKRVKQVERNAKDFWQDQSIQQNIFQFNNGSLTVLPYPTYYQLTAQLTHPVFQLNKKFPYESLNFLIIFNGSYYERDLVTQE